MRDGKFFTLPFQRKKSETTERETETIGDTVWEVVSREGEKKGSGAGATRRTEKYDAERESSQSKDKKRH